MYDLYVYINPDEDQILKLNKTTIWLPFPTDQSFNDKFSRLFRSKKKIRRLTLTCSNNKLDNPSQEQPLINHIKNALNHTFASLNPSQINEVNIKSFDSQILGQILANIHKKLNQARIMTFSNIEGKPFLIYICKFENLIYLCVGNLTK